MKNKINICIPYRDMPNCLNTMLEKLCMVKNASEISVMILEQTSDDRRFNLGKLINTGYDIFRKEWGDAGWLYMFHPVDVCPQQGFDFYLQSNFIDICDGEDQVVGFGMESDPSHYYKSCIYHPKVYRDLNGYTNNFWGWGAEDDEFFKRIQIRNKKYTRIPTSFSCWSENEEQTKSPDFLKGQSHHQQNLNLAWNLTDDTIQKDGISSLSYVVQKAEKIRDNIKHVHVAL